MYLDTHLGCQERRLRPCQEGIGSRFHRRFHWFLPAGIDLEYRFRHHQHNHSSPLLLSYQMYQGNDQPELLLRRKHLAIRAHVFHSN